MQCFGVPVEVIDKVIRCVQEDESDTRNHVNESPSIDAKSREGGLPFMLIAYSDHGGGLKCNDELTEYAETNCYKLPFLLLKHVDVIPSDLKHNSGETADSGDY